MRLFQWLRLGKPQPEPLYEYGTCAGTKARRNRLTGKVQFVLWKAGEQGHTEDYWIRFGEGWETQFKPDASIGSKT